VHPAPPLDSACIACGVSPWAESDQRTVIFTPGASIATALAGPEEPASPATGGARRAEHVTEEPASPATGGARRAEHVTAGEDVGVRLAAAQSRIDSLLRREEALERDLSASRSQVQGAAVAERRRIADHEGMLRAEISRVEGLLAEARAEVRRAEEATRADLTPGRRAIELE
jgi:hypothetical protein